jgi:hypothetical protein
VHIRGTFEEVGLAELARFVAATRQSGVLKVLAEPSGLVCFVEGRLDVAYRSHGSHRERLSAYSTAPDPLEERRMERDRLAELMRLDQSGAAFSFESKQVEPSGLPPLGLDALGRLVGRPGPVAAPSNPTGHPISLLPQRRSRWATSWSGRPPSRLLRSPSWRPGSSPGPNGRTAHAAAPSLG